MVTLHGFGTQSAAGQHSRAEPSAADAPTVHNGPVCVGWLTQYSPVPVQARGGKADRPGLV